MEHHL